MFFKLINLKQPLQQSRILESIYVLARDVYNPIFAKHNYAIKPESIYGNDFALILSDESNVLAFSLLRVQQIELLDQIHSSYFNDITCDLKTAIKSKCKNLLSIEWVTVNPICRGKFSKYQPADLIIGLSLMYAANSVFDGAIGLSRMDIGAERISPRYGATQLGVVKRYDIDSAIMFMPKSDFKLPEHSGLKNKIVELWNSHQQPEHQIAA